MSHYINTDKYELFAYRRGLFETAKKHGFTLTVKAVNGKLYHLYQDGKLYRSFDNADSLVCFFHAY